MKVLQKREENVGFDSEIELTPTKMLKEPRKLVGEFHGTDFNFLYSAEI